MLGVSDARRRLELKNQVDVAGRLRLAPLRLLLDRHPGINKTSLEDGQQTKFALPDEVIRPDRVVVVALDPELVVVDDAHLHVAVPGGFRAAVLVDVGAFLDAVAFPRRREDDVGVLSA